MRNSKAKEKELRLHEGELNVMELLWSNKVLAAKDISKIIKEYIGWEKNTTYTVIKRLIDKASFPVKILDSSVALKFQKKKFKRLKPMHYYLRCLMVHLLIS